MQSRRFCVEKRVRKSLRHSWPTRTTSVLCTQSTSAKFITMPCGTAGAKLREMKPSAKLTRQALKFARDMDEAFWKLIGQLKVSPGKVSLADCFALALAVRAGGTLVTADHHEMDRIVPLGLCPILFIR